LLHLVVEAIELLLGLAQLSAGDARTEKITSHHKRDASVHKIHFACERSDRAGV
jgi:hypothetical protein